MIENSQHSAKGPMAGYLYQCRIALFQGMEMAKINPNGSISIERFDDVAFENDDIAECLIQAKHHITGGDLGDKSADVWKTIRIWAQLTLSDPLFPTKTKLVLLTTSTAPVARISHEHFFWLYFFSARAFSESFFHFWGSTALWLRT